MSMRGYVQMARHFASCIITHSTVMYTEVNACVDEIREGQYRLLVDPATLEESFRLPSMMTVEHSRSIPKLRDD